MFGYFRPYHAGLTKKQTETFNSYYCRLCYCLRLLGGQAARAMTTFDMALYSMVVDHQLKNDPPPHLKCQRLKMENTNKFKNDTMGLRYARFTVLGFGEKIRDDMIDGKKARAGFLSLIYGNLLRDAQENEPLVYRNTYDANTRINTLQDAKAPLNEIFAAYGDMFVISFNTIGELDDAHLALIRALAEWTFFVDMVCDYADDYKTGSYNGFYTEGYPTFPEYFDAHYNEFSKIEETITGKLLSALYAIKDNSTLWYILHKVIAHAVSTVIPALIRGEDVTFHYFKELAGQFKNMKHDQKLIEESKKEN